MKKIYSIIILTGLVVLPLFQNCGMDSASQQGGLYVGVDTPDCLATVVDCGPKTEYLQITIDLSNPSVFPASNSSFVVYGRCNEGNYPSSRIRYLVYDATDLETPKDEYIRDTGDSRGGYCKDGKYSQAISILSTGINPYVVDTAYVLKVEMLGYDENTASYVHNDQTNGSSTIDFKKE